VSVTSTATRDLGATRGAPQVTVALCTWNGARWLPAFLDSLTAQDLLPDELVVQDDRSSDDTVAILEAFAATAPFEVHIEVNPERLGSTHNFEQALRRSRGQIVALADQDDVWYPTKLDRLVTTLEEDPILTLAFSDADLLGPDGAPSGRRLWESRGIGRLLRRHEVVPGTFFARRALTTGCTMAARRRAVEAALPFPASLDHAVAPMRHDRWLSLVAAAVGTVRAVPEPLLGFRVHPDQQTGVLTPVELRRRLARSAVQALGPLAAETGEEHRCRAVQLGEAADRADRLGDFEEADALRAIADHHLVRADPGATTLARLRRIGHEIVHGGYDRSLFGAASAAADAVRSVRSPVPGAS
jgi:hypothetical protein